MKVQRGYDGRERDREQRTPPIALANRDQREQRQQHESVGRSADSDYGEQQRSRKGDRRWSHRQQGGAEPE